MKYTQNNLYSGEQKLFFYAKVYEPFHMRKHIIAIFLNILIRKRVEKTKKTKFLKHVTHFMQWLFIAIN